MVIGVINIGISAAALMTGLLLLVLATGLPMWLFSGVISLIYALVVPPAAAAQTLVYGDAAAESAGSEDGSEVGAAMSPTSRPPVGSSIGVGRSTGVDTGPG